MFLGIRGFFVFYEAFGFDGETWRGCQYSPSYFVAKPCRTRCTVCGFASRLKGCLGIGVIDRGASFLPWLLFGADSGAGSGAGRGQVQGRTFLFANGLQNLSS